MIHRFLACLLLIGSVLAYTPAHAQGDPASEVIWRVNALRAAYGIPAYQVDWVLMAVAQSQASWSAQNNHIGHDGPGGSSPNERAQAAGYGAGYNSYATENAAHGTASYMTPELVVTMWQGDSVHLKALISPDYEHIGVGFAEANGFSWYVLMAGWIADGTSSVQNTPQAIPTFSVFVMSEPDETGAIYHEVQPGQTAWTIAAHYGITLAELLALNNLTEGSILHPGEMLLVRQPDTTISTPSPQASRLTPTTTLDATSAISMGMPTTPPTITAQATSVSMVSTSLPNTELQPRVDQSPNQPLVKYLAVLGAGMVFLLGVTSIVFRMAGRPKNGRAKETSEANAQRK